MPRSTSHSTIFFDSAEAVKVGISLKPSSISSAVRERISPLNSAAVIRFACSSSSSLCTNRVISSASAFCASRLCGSDSTLAARASISSLLRNVKYLRYLITSRSSVFAQNW
ncbi:hypothetical protein D3C80_1683380 [compost metagenome]